MKKMSLLISLAAALGYGFMAGDELKVEKAAIMGLSMGGYIAIDFALAYPDRVSTLEFLSGL